MRAVNFAERLPGAKLRGDEWTAICPAHDDAKASLTFRDGEKGILVKCFAGCRTEAICERLGLPVRDLFFDAPSNGQATRRIVKTYDYRDETGTVLHQVVRYVPKGFRQRQPDGKGGWTWDVKGVRPVVYQLPHLAGRPRVYKPEGEEDVDRLRSLGLPATCNSGGAGKWTDELTQQLKAAGVHEVIVLPDNDEPGRQHAQSVARSCVAAGLTAKIVTLPNLPPKGDVSDFLDAGRTIGELQALVEAATPWKLEAAEQATEAPATPDPGELWRCTDVGNGELFARQRQEIVRYCYGLKQWFVWDGQRWKPDDGGHITLLAKQTALSIYTLAAKEPDELRRKALAKWAAESETERRLKSMVSLAQSEPGIAIEADRLDADPLLLNVLNGTLDLRTGELRPAQRADFITKLVPVAYRPDAVCPEFERLLDRLFKNVPAVREYLQRIFGYALTGVTTEQCFFILYGTGSNGKSTVLRAILDLLGDYATTTRPETFLTKRGDGIPNDIAALAGARFVVSLESEQGRRLAEGLVKGMTGGDRLSARFLNREFFSFVPQLKLFIGTNHKPTITGTDHGMWRRVRGVPFAEVIPDHEQDKLLSEKLRAEYDGILRWLVEGCLAWQRDGLGPPLEVQAATAAYRAEQDILGVFLKDRCVLEPTAKSTKSELFESYIAWCEASGERHRLTLREFGKALRERGIIDAKVGNSKGCHGLRLRTPLDAEPDDDELVAAQPDVVADES